MTKQVFGLYCIQQNKNTPNILKMLVLVHIIAKCSVFEEENMMKEIRIGLVGSGWMGKAHSSALADAQMLFGPEYGVAKFVVVADSNEAAAKAAQEKIGFERVTTDWHDVVTAPDVDLVDIATPNAFHYEVARAALENGKNV